MEINSWLRERHSAALKISILILSLFISAFLVIHYITVGSIIGSIFISFGLFLLGIVPMIIYWIILTKSEICEPNMDFLIFACIEDEDVWKLEKLGLFKVTKIWGKFNGGLLLQIKVKDYKTFDIYLSCYTLSNESKHKIKENQTFFIEETPYEDSLTKNFTGLVKKYTLKTEEEWKEKTHKEARS